MTKRVLLACLAALALSAQAAPITFINTQFDVTAVALSDGAPGFDSQSSPPLPTTISASADSIGTTGLATAGAIGGPGLLLSSADVNAAGGLSSAVATSHFSGTFLNDQRVILEIDFAQLAFTTGSGTGATSLFVLLMSDGVTLFEDYVTGPWKFDYLPTLGTVSVLDLTLTSEATAGFLTAGDGGASSFGQVTFGRVPLPATAPLVLLALGAMVRIRRHAGPTPTTA